jgi:hypothetical protein
VTSSHRKRFGAVAAVLLVAVAVGTALRTPADPLSFALRFVPGAVVALVLAYWVTYT